MPMITAHITVINHVFANILSTTKGATNGKEVAVNYEIKERIIYYFIRYSQNQLFSIA